MDLPDRLEILITHDEDITMGIADDYEMPAADNSQADRRLVVRFSLQPRIDSRRTEEEGREVYREVEFITILIPGDKTLTINRPVMASDKQRFPLQYQAFKNKQGEALIGTPLSAWPLVNEAQRRELEYFNIRTVDQLAEVADNFAGSMMGVHALKGQAQRYLAAAKEAAPTVKLQQELVERDNKIAAMQDQLTKLADLVEKGAAKPDTGKKSGT
jgi:hypothetical protein